MAGTNNNRIAIAQASVASRLLNTRRTNGVPQRQQEVISRRMQSAANCVKPQFGHWMRCSPEDAGHANHAASCAGCADIKHHDVMLRAPCSVESVISVF
jgi:hypothetical protein